MKMISMKKAPKPKNKLRSNMVAEEPYGDENKYPYGLEINLEDESIKKLGIDMQNTRAGDTVTIVCEADVTHLSQRERMTKGKSKTSDSISLQITDMAYNVSMK